MFETEKINDLLGMKQFELSDGDIEFLGANQYSDASWEVVGRRHSVDPSTRKLITAPRVFYAQVKKWAPTEPPKVDKILTTANINSTPLPMDSSLIREELRKRDLTIPVSDETTTEEV